MTRISTCSSLNDTEKAILEVSDGNFGALGVLSDFRRTFGEGDFSTVIHHLRQLGFSGADVWTCWNDYARKDSKKFFEALRTHNPVLLAAVEQERARYA